MYEKILILVYLSLQSVHPIICFFSEILGGSTFACHHDKQRLGMDVFRLVFKIPPPSWPAWENQPLLVIMTSKGTSKTN